MGQSVGPLAEVRRHQTAPMAKQPTSLDQAATQPADVTAPAPGTGTEIVTPVDPLAPIGVEQAAAIVGIPVDAVFAWDVTLDEVVVVTVDGRKVRGARP